MTAYPKQPFAKVEELDRLRLFMLGLPMQRYSKIVPWGYKPSEADDWWLEPIDICFQYLVEAKKYLNESTTENLSAWISAETGVPISPTTLYNIMHYRMPDDRATLPLKQRNKI